jgi:transcription elongation factor GreB
MVRSMAGAGRSGDVHKGIPKSNYITPEGFERLQQELDFLWRVERPKVTQAVSVAAAQGDRSENADYIYGKKRLREIDRRVRFLSKRIDELEVVGPSSRPSDKVYFAAWVSLEDAEGRKLRYRLVGPDEFDVSSGLISVDSPMGRSLLGKQVDDQVVVERPRGRTEYVIVAIEY